MSAFLFGLFSVRSSVRIFFLTFIQMLKIIPFLVIANVAYIVWSFNEIYKDSYFRATDKNFLKYFRKHDKRIYLTKGLHTVFGTWGNYNIPLTVDAEVDGWYIHDYSEEERRNKSGTAGATGHQFSRKAKPPKGYILMDKKANEEYVSKHYIAFQNDVKYVWVRNKENTITSIVILVLLNALVLGVSLLFS